LPFADGCPFLAEVRANEWAAVYPAAISASVAVGLLRWGISLKMSPMKHSVRISCPVCGSSEEVIHWNQEVYCMVRCQGCGLFYQSLRLSEEELLRRYQEEHRVKKSKSRTKPRWTDGQPWTVSGEIPEKFLIDYRSTLARVEKYKEKGNLLEIGFGPAFLLLVAREAGWKVTGVEVSEADIVRVKDKYRLNVWCGKVEGSPYPERSFDVVVARHTLEHVYELAPFLTTVWSILKDDGLFVVDTPNIAGLEYRMRNLPAMLHVRGPIWEKMYLPEHLYYFSPKTLTRLMGKYGFTPIAWETYSHFKKHGGLGHRIANLRHLLKVGNKMRFLLKKDERSLCSDEMNRCVWTPKESDD
jgi:SAM-dependent methyltransferase